jgi:hypothetical protein
VILTIVGIIADDPDNLVIQFKGPDGRRYRQQQASVREILDQHVRTVMESLFIMASTGNPEDIRPLIGRTIEVRPKSDSTNGKRSN